MRTDPQLRLLFPELLPTEQLELAKAARLLTERRLGDALLRSDAATRARGRRELAALVDLPAAEAPVATRSEACDEHDQHFDVARISGDPGTVFLVGLLMSYLDMQENVERMGTSLAQTEWNQLMGAPAAIFGFALGPGSHERAIIPERGPEYLPLERWQVGHRQFFTLIQSIAVALGGLLAASKQQDVPQMRDWALLAARQVLGAAASLRLAADFRPADYSDGVRASMLPPQLGPGFSGLQTRDHRHLVTLFRRVRSALPALEPAREEYEEFVGAVGRLYEAHAFVCSRFGGDQLPSLLMEATGHGANDKSGVEVVHEFTARRVGLLVPADRRDALAVRGAD